LLILILYPAGYSRGKLRGIKPYRLRLINQRRYIDERSPFDERNPVNQRFIDDHEIFIRDVNQRFGHFVDGVFVVGFHPQSYINSIVIIEGNYFYLSRIFANVAIGAGVIIVTTVALPALLPGGVPVLAILVKKFPTTGAMVRTSLANAAFGSAINGTVEFVRSDGDLQATFEGALTGFGEGFKWGAITVAGVNATGLEHLNIYKTRG